MVSRGIKLIMALVAMCVALPLAGQSLQELQEGDLLFCCADTANAITAVTCGVEELPIDHVAVFHRIGGERGIPFVVEAIQPVVQLTPIDTFLYRSPHVIVGRVTADCSMERSVKKCIAMLDKPYDDLYLPGDSAVYCSELVQLNYVTSEGSLVFEPVPMSFHDDSGRVTDYWIEFYRQRGMTVPEGEPGTNPGELSRRPQITIIGKFTRTR